MRQDVWLEVGWLCKLLVAPVEWTNVWPVTCVNPYVRSKVEVEWKPFTAALESALQTAKCWRHLSIIIMPQTQRWSDIIIKIQIERRRVKFVKIIWKPDDVENNKTVPAWNGFSPVWTSWCRFSFELSTNDLPHSAQTWTRGPCVCRCFRIAALSRNIFVQPCQEPTNYPDVDAKKKTPTKNLFCIEQTALKRHKYFFDKPYAGRERFCGVRLRTLAVFV